MTLKDRFATPAPTKNGDIACARYEAVSGTKRCRHYVAGGSCALPDELQCIEWLRANGHPVPAASASQPPLVVGHAALPTAELDDGVQRDLFGDPVEVPAPPTQTPKTEPVAVRRIEAPARSDDIPLVRDLTADEVASFKALGAEVCLASDAIGEVWIVPEYTNQDRGEISVEHAATLAAICSAFPGAKVVSFEREASPPPPPSELQERTAA
jgi:hypothetical protein